MHSEMLPRAVLLHACALSSCSRRLNPGPFAMYVLAGECEAVKVASKRAAESCTCIVVVTLCLSVTNLSC